MKSLIGKGRDTYPPLYAGSDQFTSNTDKEEALNKFSLLYSYIDVANPQLRDQHDVPNICNNMVASEQGVNDLIHQRQLDLMESALVLLQTTPTCPMHGYVQSPICT